MLILLLNLFVIFERNDSDNARFLLLNLSMRLKFIQKLLYGISAPLPTVGEILLRHGNLPTFHGYWVSSDVERPLLVGRKKIEVDVRLRPRELLREVVIVQNCSWQYDIAIFHCRLCLFVSWSISRCRGNISLCRLEKVSEALLCASGKL